MKQLLVTSVLSAVIIVILLNIMVDQHDKYMNDLHEKETTIHKQEEKIQNLNKTIQENKMNNNELQKQIQSLDKQRQELNKKVEDLQKELNSINLFEVTAYTSGYESTGKTSSHPAYEVTASGKKVEDHVTVACPPSMKFGTELYIQGIGHRVCTDRGEAIQGNKLDVYIADLKDALQFGRRYLWVKILNKGE